MIGKIANLHGHYQAVAAARQFRLPHSRLRVTMGWPFHPGGVRQQNPEAPILLQGLSTVVRGLRGIRM